jgi:hypothetical protein
VSRYTMSDTKRGGVPTSNLRTRGSGVLGVTMGVMDGGVVIPLSAIGLHGKRVPPRGPWICLEVRT